MFPSNAISFFICCSKWTFGSRSVNHILLMNSWQSAHFLWKKERRGESNCFLPSLPLSLCGYQLVSGEELVSVNVMGRCFLWLVCLLLIRAHPSAGPPSSRGEGTVGQTFQDGGFICPSSRVTTGPRPASPPRGSDKGFTKGGIILGIDSHLEEHNKE